ncbi:MAG: hypothetical protein RL711_1099 [Bacteroidota bacterium]|jgi:hypothetical protein
MIISNKHQFIFIAIPKTATHAIRFAVRPQLGEDDMEQVLLFMNKKMPFKELSAIQHGHIKCKEIQPLLSEEVWHTYFKFAIVRNPYERFVSFCAFTNKDNPNFSKTPQSYMYQALLNKKTHKQILFIPQSEFLFSNEGKLMVDYVGRQESLQESFDDICLQTGLKSEKLQQVNASVHKHYSEYYNDELKRMVYNFYKDDFMNFGYSEDLSNL